MTSGIDSADGTAASYWGFIVYLIAFCSALAVHLLIHPTFSFLDDVLPRPTLSEPIGTVLTWGAWTALVSCPILISFAVRHRFWPSVLVGGATTSLITSIAVSIVQFKELSIEIIVEGYLLYCVLIGGTTIFVATLFRVAKVAIQKIQK